MESLAVGIVVALALVVSLVGALAVRNRIFFKLGIRNVTRRRARTALIVLGLMLGTTIIASALVTGDTMSHTIRTAAITSLGQTDELVSVRGAEVDTEVEVGGTTGIEYFPEEVFPEIEYELLLGHEDLIDGVAPRDRGAARRPERHDPAERAPGDAFREQPGPPRRFR